MTLRDAVKKLATENPELRKHLLPLLRKSSGGHFNRAGDQADPEDILKALEKGLGKLEGHAYGKVNRDRKTIEVYYDPQVGTSNGYAYERPVKDAEKVLSQVLRLFRGSIEWSNLDLGDEDITITVELK